MGIGTKFQRRCGIGCKQWALKQADCTHSLVFWQAGSCGTNSEEGNHWHVTDKVVQHYVKLHLGWIVSVMHKRTADTSGQAAGGKERATRTSFNHSLEANMWWLLGLLLGCPGDVCSRKDIVSVGTSLATAYDAACTRCSRQGDPALLHVLAVVLQQLRGSALCQYMELSERYLIYLCLSCDLCGLSGKRCVS